MWCLSVLDSACHPYSNQHRHSALVVASILTQYSYHTMECSCDKMNVQREQETCVCVCCYAWRTFDCSPDATFMHTHTICEHAQPNQKVVYSIQLHKGCNLSNLREGILVQCQDAQGVLDLTPASNVRFKCAHILTRDIHDFSNMWNT